jgi:hypothetical protein
MLQLYLWHGFYNIVFKIKHKLYIASASSSPPTPASYEILGAHLTQTVTSYLILLVSTIPKISRTQTNTR